MLHEKLLQKVYLLKYLEKQKIQFEDYFETTKLNSSNYNRYLERYHQHLITLNLIKQTKEIITIISC